MIMSLGGGGGGDSLAISASQNPSFVCGLENAHFHLKSYNLKAVGQNIYLEYVSPGVVFSLVIGQSLSYTSLVFRCTL